MMSLSTVMDSTTPQSRPPPPPWWHLTQGWTPPGWHPSQYGTPQDGPPLRSTSGWYPSYWNAFLFKSELCSPLIVDFTLPKSEKHKIARIIFFSSTLHFTLFTFTKIQRVDKINMLVVLWLMIKKICHSRFLPWYIFLFQFNNSPKGKGNCQFLTKDLY